MSDITLRIASEQDHAALRELVGGFRDHLGASAPSGDEIDGILPALFADPAIEFSCAFGAGGEALGYAHTRYHTSLWSPGVGAHLEDLFVAQAARGTGLGRELLRFALELARMRGARFMSLSTNERNAVGRSLYESEGFALQSEPLYGDGRELCLVRRL